ncbi:hypothetical protein H4696_003303 [Amycolatopsis lexingtonensis]|uniref:Uncharacterized protein n=1 Tax=Amycolatopsis lexingtonensis TaxID=218822 RepID=A0ABR9HZ54_9PSEU|nr:hypothetical protein [Amycolatopsis lexingtonensis]MBE1496203.1 hypothetical protein [Amycolatopsis lexingtonensis]
MLPSAEEEAEESFGALADGGVEQAGGVPAILPADALGVTLPEVVRSRTLRRGGAERDGDEVLAGGGPGA